MNGRIDVTTLPKLLLLWALKKVYEMGGRDGSRSPSNGS